MTGILSEITDSLLFPIPKPATYTIDSYKNSLLWIPKSNQIESAIPCLWFPYAEADILLVFRYSLYV